MSGEAPSNFLDMNSPRQPDFHDMNSRRQPNVHDMNSRSTSRILKESEEELVMVYVLMYTTRGLEGLSISFSSLPRLSLIVINFDGRNNNYRYEQFVQEGKLLEGEDLDFAYDSISAFASRPDNQEAVFAAEEGLKDIRDATLAYKAEALQLRRQLRHLHSQFDMLTDQASTLIQGRRAKVAATSTVNGHLTTIDDSLSARNLQMNAVLGRMASTEQELAHYHSGDGDGIYLAYSDFHPYLIGDSSCIKELNQWFAKQLDTISDHYILFKKPETIAVIIYFNHFISFKNLQRSFGTSERQWVEAQVENAKQQAILMALNLRYHQMKLTSILIFIPLGEIMQNLLENYRTLIPRKRLLFETIPGLCWELAQLQDTCILQGDYDLKVMRQEYYINRQKAGRCLALIQAASDVQEQGGVDDQDHFLHGPLMKELDEMEKINAKLPAAVEEVTLEHRKKIEIVKHHAKEIGLQRGVFVEFFCNPDRLRSQVRELTARVRALQVS
ncbi:hypothetical protein DVH24_010291 [Malus domestica]|uniref:HAUS augmin-like complex subunit 3 N-terminal domain-containing protein n=1 Tax=Malus domestica TaxID=3750 RepID=A0A498JSE8_MALDO|nr:hypothetical protein DVH24_010291 [Malus domestica]